MQVARVRKKIFLGQFNLTRAKLAKFLYKNGIPHPNAQNLRNSSTKTEILTLKKFFFRFSSTCKNFTSIYLEEKKIPHPEFQNPQPKTDSSP